VINVDKKISGIIAGFDRQTELYLAGIQQRLYDEGFVGEQTKNIPMHITLGLYSADKENKLQLMELVSEAANNTLSFNVSFTHMGIFGGAKTVFIAPDTGKELLSLKERFGGVQNWTPHVTLLIDTPERIYKALPLIADSFKPFTGRLEYICLYEFWPASRLCEFRLS
jgi:hypothetical protein